MPQPPAKPALPARWTSTGQTAYLAAPDFAADLKAELGECQTLADGLYLAPGPARPEAWAANIWHTPEYLHFGSIGEAVRALRARQRNWAGLHWDHHRRAALIQEQLPRLIHPELPFPPPARPLIPMGSWTLLAPDRLLAAGHCDSPWPHGEWRFQENRDEPPNRAYLKLWEALARLGRWPQPGDSCVDLGASPGGWTWVLQGLGARVLAVDKAPLAPQIAALPGVTCRQESAFAFELTDPVDWLCCDVICYPARLLGHVQRWLASGLVKNCVITLKFQGETDHASARAFAAIPGSRLLHLSHNKHELTWLWPG